MESVRRFQRAIFFLVLFLSPALVPAESVAPRSIFEEGNRFFESKDYAAARDRYEELVLKGFSGPALFHNLGNAYYRLGRIGRARLWYERALRIAPRDADIQANVELVRSLAQETPPPSDAWSFLARNRGFLAWAFFLINAGFFLLLGWSLFRDGEVLWWGRWTLGLLLLLSATAFFLTRAAPAGADAVIVGARAEVRSGPGDEYRVGFVVPEGQKVSLFQRQGAWSEIGVAGKGLKGWVSSESVEPIAF